MVNLLKKLINPLKHLTPKGMSPRGLEINATKCHRSGYAERISKIKPLQDARKNGVMEAKITKFGAILQARIMRPLNRNLVLWRRRKKTVSLDAGTGEKACA